MHNRHTRTANLLGATAVVVADAMRASTEEVTGLGGAVPGALVTIHAFRGQSIEELRRALGLSQPGAVRLVDRLSAEGWVERRPGPDARAVALVLTPIGRRVARRLLDERAGALARLLEPLSAAQREELTGGLEALLHARGREGRDPRHVCRLCERAVCERCPVAQGAREAC
jgi:MarR family transcriptional repressor of emrRAB